MVALSNHHINPFWDKPFLGLLKTSAFKKTTPVTSTYSDPYQLFLCLLVEARKESKLTQTLLSKRLGKPQSFVSKYERGERRLDVIEFLEVCKQLEADPYKIMHRLENTSPQT
ncbi:helix-turn-helix transcriptional regulator [Pseudomonas putida]|uniref:helix-turn-helix domain-containing protein n=1 Tax=Pseudomonas putida TaxID=303 RepID=UPI00296EC6E2|nr:helix-turn-helix transcriptional regulator [Pseudomonas putida]